MPPATSSRGRTCSWSAGREAVAASIPPIPFPRRNAMRARAVVVVAVGLLVRPGVLTAGGERSDAEALQGTWRVVSQQRAGRATEQPRDMQWVVEGDTIELVLAGG